METGNPGFDAVGDSALFMGDPVRQKVTAKRGTRLHYLCVIHPWMQGRINVR